MTRPLDSAVFHRTLPLLVLSDLGQKGVRSVEVFDLTDPTRPRTVHRETGMMRGRVGETERFADSAPIVRLDSGFWDVSSWTHLRDASGLGVSLSPSGQRNIYGHSLYGNGWGVAGMELASGETVKPPPDLHFAGVPVWSADEKLLWVRPWEDNVEVNRRDRVRHAPSLLGLDTDTLLPSRRVSFDDDSPWADLTWVVPNELVGIAVNFRPLRLHRLDSKERISIGVHRGEPGKLSSTGLAQCKLFAFDDHDHFEGQAAGALHLRERSAPYAVIDAGPELEKHRVPGLLRRFLLERVGVDRRGLAQ